MNTIPEQQIADRWDTLPMILREAMTSPINSELVWKTAETEHLPQEKIAVVSRLAGYTLMGFLHPEDIAKEIQDALGINQNIAASIAGTLNSRIFSPLRNDLEKIYAPAVPETQQPKIVQEIERPIVFATDIPVRPPVASPIKTISEMKFPIAPKPVVANAPPTNSEQSRTVGLGGPKIISIDGSDSSTPLTASKPTTSVAPSTTLEIKKIPEPPKPSSPGLSHQSSVNSHESATPGPVIIHQESEFAPVKSVSGFKLEIPQQESKGIKPDSAIPPRPAQIEIGSILEAKLKPTPQKPEISAVPRVVHYSESRTPFNIAQGKPLALIPLEKISQVPKPPPPAIAKGGPTPTPTAHIPKPPSPPSNLPTMMQSEKNIQNPSKTKDGIFNRLTQKIFPARKFLPDPLKEPELPPLN